MAAETAGAMSDNSASPRWTRWLPLALFGLFAALVLYALIRPASKDVPSRFVGQALPEFSLPPAAEGSPGLSRADLSQGKPRLLNVFASWCIPCAVESPQLAQITANGVEVDGIAVRDHRDDLTAFLQRNGNPYARIGADDLSKLQLAIGSSGVPESFIIDGKGTIRYQHIGEIRATDIPMLMQKLAEAEQ